MKKLILGLTLLASMASFASDSFRSKVERYNMMVQTGSITTQDFTDLVAALNPREPIEVKKETREERIQKWEGLLESNKITGQE
ncbi:hypothetical protein OAT67_08400, partial [Bacteriovoracaceae bacterium]|nr:hypothetical protein [Bacteriovoracaceae bacterium]